MVVFPNAKINLGLNILRKRADGFHDLSTIFYPIPLQDVLEIVPQQQRDAKADVVLYSTGLAVVGNIDDNICVKAYRLLKADFPNLPAIALHLHKIIPMGAGMGGGSADGAFTLRLLNEQFQLQLTEAQLISYALQLGSDCPFFIVNAPTIGKGRGEDLTLVQLDLSAYSIAIVNPGIHIPTGWAFQQIKPSLPEYDCAAVIQDPPNTWRGRLINDFEAPIVAHYPEIGKAIEQLYARGAVYAAMSGSGSTVFGIFHHTVSPQLQWPEHYFYKLLSLDKLS
jgi:4-diphosphocytidyl-2-C-methyl-D-erythritol kinase